MPNTNLENQNEELENIQNADVKQVVIDDEVLSVDEAVASPIVENDFKKGGRKSTGKGRGGSRPPRAPREKPEFDTKTIDVRRVTRVVSGGRRFSLAVALAAGDKNGRIGFGTGKALDTQLAIEKATKSAKKNMITLKLAKGNKIPYDVKVKYKSASLWLTPNKGKGIVAGSSARAILSLAGVNDVTAKFHSGTKNKMNNAKATMKALKMFTR
jgi:small subunit ribosomal protein S5